MGRGAENRGNHAAYAGGATKQTCGSWSWPVGGRRVRAWCGRTRDSSWGHCTGRKSGLLGGGM
eukprot:11009778-Lingulodinium_polyedra.AAC.1